MTRSINHQLSVSDAGEAQRSSYNGEHVNILECSCPVKESC